MIYVSIISVFLVYYISFYFIKNNEKTNNLYAFIPTGIIAILLLILFYFREALGIYIVLFIVVVTSIVLNSILLIKNKRVLSSIINLVPFVIGISIILWFYYINVINDPCEGVEECMNETGMIMVYGLMFIVVSFITTLVSHFVFILPKRTDS